MLFSAHTAWRPLLKSVAAFSLALVVGCDSTSKPQADHGTSTASTVQKGEAIRVGMSGSYFPFTFSKADQLQGFEIDVWNELSKRLNRPVEFVTSNFSGLFGMLEAGKIDTISNQITKTDNRQQKYLFSDTYVYDGAQVVVHQDNQDIHGFKDLCNKTVSVNLGSNYEALLKEKDVSKCIDIKTYDTGFEHDVVIGRTDAFVMDRNSVLAVIKESNLPLKLAGDPIDYMENALPFRKDKESQALLKQVNLSLSEMRKDGTLKAISEKWFQTDISVKGQEPQVADQNAL